MLSRMFRSFERSCLPQEIQPPDWNLSLVLRCLSRPPLEPLKLASDKHLTWKTSFYLLLSRPKGLMSCTAFASGFIIRTDGNPIPSLSFLTSWLRPRIIHFLNRFEEFSVLSLDDFVGDAGLSVALPSRPFRNTCPGWSSTIQVLRACLFPQNVGRRGCPVAPFPSSCFLSSPWLVYPLQRRIVAL